MAIVDCLATANAIVAPTVRRIEDGDQILPTHRLTAVRFLQRR